MLTVQDSEHKGLPIVGGNEREHGGCRHEPGVRKAYALPKAHQSVAWRVEQGLYICGIIFTRYILSGTTSCVRGSGVSHAKFKLSGLKRSMANCVAIVRRSRASFQV